MTVVLLLALAASTAAACSTVLKAHSARRGVAPAWAARLPSAVASIIASPVFALAMVFDGVGIALQMAALHRGGLSVVQPVLCAALVISLGLNHVADRTRITGREIGWAALLVAGLVTFLAASGALDDPPRAEIGRRIPAAVLAVLGLAFVAWAVLGTRRASSNVHARALGAAVAAIYATTAALMTSVTHIAGERGLLALVLSWQLWTLLVVAGAGLVLGQQAFAAAPLRVPLPVIASLDPLLSLLIGVTVYAEVLRTTPLALLGEAVGLGALLVAVARLSTLSAD